MAANTLALYPITPVCAMGQISSANTNRDGTGIIATILTAGTYGTRVDRVLIQATGTTTAGMVRLYIGDDAGSPNIRCIGEVNISAATPSSTVKAFSATLVFDRGLILPYNYTLRASTHNAETFNIVVYAGNY